MNEFLRGLRIALMIIGLSLMAFSFSMLMRAHAAEPQPKSVTITSTAPDGKPCAITFDDPTLALAWARVVLGDMDPDLYMRLYKLEMPGDIDAWLSAQHIVDACMGAGL